MALSQIVKNGTFDTDSIWIKTSGAVIANGELTVTVTGGSYQYALQLLDYIDGAGYEMTATVNGTAGSQIRFRDAVDDSGGLTIATGTITFSGSPQEVKLSWTANSNSTRINMERHSGGDYSWTIDNIRIAKKTPFNDIIKPADVPTPIFNDIIRTYAGEEPWQAK